MSMSVTMHPIWQSGALILACTVGAALLLQILVHRFLPGPVRRAHTAVGGAIFSVIGTTYAVLLAFMATAAWQQYSSAQALARHEAELIGTIYSISHGIPEPAGTAFRSDLVTYLARIVHVEWPAQIAGNPVPAEEPLLVRLNQKVLAVSPDGLTQSNAQGFLINALSEVATLRRDRRLTTHGTIPDLVWVVLLSGGALMVAFSYVLGAPSAALHLLMTAALVASGVLVLLLIVGLSSPFHGEVTIAPDAYADVLAEMRGAQ